MKASIREEAKRIDAACSHLRRPDPEAAAKLWEGLARGELSLLDRFESDGRRYLLAVRNSPGMQSGLALSRRETHIAMQAASGQPIKRIAYSLGLAPSTVSAHLASAMRKLGTPTRAELAHCLSGFPQPPPASPARPR